MKKLLLVLILVLIVVSCLFPPWRRIYKEPKSNIKKFEPVGYSFITEPPYVRAPVYDKYDNYKGTEDVKADTIDFSRLGIQLGLLLFLGSCIVFSKYIFPKTPSKPKPALSDELPLKKKRKWIAKTLTCLLILVLVGYGTVMTIFYDEAVQKWDLWHYRYTKLDKEYNSLKAKQQEMQEKKKGNIRHDWLNGFEAGLEAGAENKAKPELQPD